MIDIYKLSRFLLPCASNDNQGDPASDYSADELFILRRMMNGEHVTFENSGVPEQTWNGLMERLNRTIPALSDLI